MTTKEISAEQAKVIIRNAVEKGNCEFLYFSKEYSDEHGVYIENEDFECWINTREQKDALQCLVCNVNDGVCYYTWMCFDVDVTIDMLRTSVMFHEAYYHDEDVNHAYDERHGDMPEWAEQEYLNFVAGKQRRPPVTPCGMSNFATDWLGCEYRKG